MVTLAQAQQAAALAQEVAGLEASISNIQAVIAKNHTVSLVTVWFNESPAPMSINNTLNQVDTTALLSAGVTILQGYLATAQAALAAIS